MFNKPRSRPSLTFLFLLMIHNSDSKGVIQKFMKITNAFLYLQASWSQIYFGGV